MIDPRVNAADDGTLLDYNTLDAASSAHAFEVPKTYRRASPAQVKARDANWARLQVAGSYGNLLTARNRGDFDPDDAADLLIALEALRRIEKRRVERQPLGPTRDTQLGALERQRARWESPKQDPPLTATKPPSSSD